MSARDQKRFEKAKGNYFGREYEEAEELLLKVVSSSPGFAEGFLLLGDIMMETGRPEEAVNSYCKVIEIDSTSFPVAYKLAASAEFINLNYDRAASLYEKYLLTGNITGREKEDILRQVRISRFRASMMANPVIFEPVNLGEKVNSPDDEYINTLTADESRIFFTRKSESGREGHRQFMEDFYYSELSGGEWQKARLLGSPVDSRGDAGAMTVSPDGNIMYFTSCFRPGSFGSCDLYRATRAAGQWTRPVNLGERINSDLWDSQPSLAPDGKTLYFASNREGGNGKSDIWKTEMMPDGSWGMPENLGPSINTAGTEMAPFIHFDNKSLYFSSDGHPGMGGMDLFIARKETTGKWETPENLGYPLNTREDGLAVIVNARGDKGYLSARKKDGFGNYDIYEFLLPEKYRPEPVTYLKGTIYDAVTGERLVARFELLDLDNGEPVMAASSSPEGEFLLCIPTDRNYALHVSKKNYLFYSDHFALKGVYEISEPYHKDVYLQPIDTGKAVVLENIFFDFDSFELKPESNAELDKLFEFLEANRSVSIEIGGHTDSIGSAAYNRELSMNRATSVMEYLIGKGIDPSRLSAKGYGFSRPVASNETEEGRALNRRTEIRITGIRR